MRWFFCIVLLCVLPLVPIVVALAAFILYVIIWPGLEVLIIGIAIDSFFGTHAGYPLYTIMASLILLSLVWLKPQLSVYNE